MAVLNAWQRLDRVISGLPFGSGADGAYSSATIPTLTKDSCSGSAASTTLTTAGSTFANGDILLIHQSRGTGVGQWEINKVNSGGGSTSLTLQVALNYTYTDSGASQAQAIKIPQYTDVTVQSGTWTVPTWDANVGGILTFAAKGIVTVTGTTNSTGVGFKGGPGGQAVGANGQAGEGYGSSTQNPTQTTPNGTSGAGGGQGDNPNTGDQGGGGGGGGSSGSGSNGQTSGSRVGGTAGSANTSTADLINIGFGGAGGAGGRDGDGATAAVPAAGNGGGVVIIFAKDISITGAINSKGSDGANGGNWNGNGGGGGGGNVLIVCSTATLGSNLINATKGAAGTGGTVAGGAGSDGRIAIHHFGTVTGTTSPMFDDTSDPTLLESSGFLPFL